MRDTPSVVAVVGCGGKTTFIESLAREFCGKRILITPTTKIFPMEDTDIVLRRTLAECEAHSPVNGIQCLGIYNKTNGKLEAMPPKLLARIYSQYDLVLLEADGSRGLPCKGWRENEPVIPLFCTHTIGIVTLNALLKAADEEHVLNLDRFLKLTGLKSGDIITPRALIDMVCGEEGMFRNAVGRQFLFINQAEDEKHAAAAVFWIREWPKELRSRFPVLVYGSASKNLWMEG